MRRIYGAWINCALLSEFLSSLSDMRRAQKKGQIDKAFVKRIMLAVTHVNGCKLCSWFHTKEALKLGMTEKEIAELLDGDISDAPKDEAVALVFAQHYADTLGNVDNAAWLRVVQTYGTDKALAIRACVCMIMAGNAQGNIWGALASRFKGKPEPDSSLWKEISVLACDIFLVPFMLVWAAYRELMRRLIPSPYNI